MATRGVGSAQEPGPSRSSGRDAHVSRWRSWWAGWIPRLRSASGNQVTAGLAALLLALIFIFLMVTGDLAPTPALLLLVTLNGLTLAGLYFLVASGFTLVFGAMRVVNMAHGSFYLLAGYIGWSTYRATDSWIIAVLAGGLSMAFVGLLVDRVLLSRVRGAPLREALITIGVAVIIADLVIAGWEGRVRVIAQPDWFTGSIPLLPDGGLYPVYRLFVLALSIGVGFGLWALIHRSPAGIVIRASVDDRYMLSALGVNVELVYAGIFTLGGMLAGLAGVIGGSFLSLAPGVDGRYLLVSLVVVIVGGMGSLGGAAFAALVIGLVDQFATVFSPQYSGLYTFVLMVVVLAVRPQGLFGKAA